MQGLRDLVTRYGRLMTVPLVVLGLALAVSIGGCGDDDDDCGYIFSDVPDEVTCENLGEEFDCNVFAYNSTDDTCTINGCLICQDIDTDFDGDFDFDGDIDDDD